jgi:hypothetical protein
VGRMAVISATDEARTLREKDTLTMSTKKPAVGSSKSSKLVPSFMSLDHREELLEGVEARRRNVTTLIQQVISGVKVAACFYGPGGHGKSWAVKKELDSLTGKSWRHHAGSVTPRGLFDELHKYKDSLHVFEDMEELLKSPPYGKLLRPALDDGAEERWIEWTTADDVAKFVFSGGIIIVGNEDLSKSRSEIGEAVKSRVKPIKWELNIQEIMAVMKKMADTGWSRRGNSLATKNCHEVADYLIECMSGGHAMHGIDLRFFQSHSLPARFDSLSRNLGDEWKRVILAMLEGQANEIESRETRADRLMHIALQVNMIDGTKEEKCKKWNEMTDLACAQYYNMLKLAKNGQKGK